MSNYVNFNCDATPFQNAIYKVTADGPRRLMKLAFAISALAFSILMVKMLIIAGTSAGLTYGFALNIIDITLEYALIGFTFCSVSLVRDVFAGIVVAIQHRDGGRGLKAFSQEVSYTFSAFTSVGNWIARKCYRIATI